MISFFPILSSLLMIAVLAFGVSGIGWNAVYLTIVGEAVDRESTGLATGVGYFFGFLGSVVPASFRFSVDRRTLRIRLFSPFVCRDDSGPFGLYWRRKNLS